MIRVAHRKHRRDGKGAHRCSARRPEKRLKRTEIERGWTTVTVMSAGANDHRRRRLPGTEHAIETTAPFFYAAVLAEAPCDTIVGVGEPIGNKISGVFLAARYPSFSNAG